MQLQPINTELIRRTALTPEEVRSLFVKGAWRFAKHEPEKPKKHGNGHGTFKPVTEVPEANFEGLTPYERRCLKYRIRYAKRKLGQA